jgi:hypothetical protein
MNKILALLSLLILVCIGESNAQTSTTFDKRQRLQRHRIQNGVESGELTRREAAEARHDQRTIRRIERRVHSDGVVTSHEMARPHYKQNKAVRELRWDKHDGQAK